MWTRMTKQAKTTKALSAQVNTSMAAALHKPLKFPFDQPQPTTLYDWRNVFSYTQLKYIRTISDAERELNRIISLRPYAVVGFDLEWRPSFAKRRKENPVALVQLAFEEVILLIQVSAMRGSFPQILRTFLESAQTVKVGVAIQNDCKKLFKDFGVSVRSCVDLSLLARSVDSRWKGSYKASVGLARLCSIYLDRLMPKGHVKTSNWEAFLTEHQQNYAANDCQSSLIIYYKLLARTMITYPEPVDEFWTFDAIYGVNRDPHGRPWFPFNPYYDPGPPPTLKLIEPAAADGDSSGPSSPTAVGLDDI